MLMNQVHHKETGFKKIAIPTLDGFELIPVDQVIRCEADDNYTHLFLKNKNKIVACRTLKGSGRTIAGIFTLRACTPFISCEYK